jgi:hypothetical protein
MKTSSQRFFSDDSFWNQPIGRNAATDPGSDRFLEILSGEYGGSFWINCREYAIPLCEVDTATPRRSVRQRELEAARKPGRWAPREKYWSHGPGFGHDVPIPDNALPDPGTDHHLALVDWARDTVWDMWACRRRPDGEWESRTGMVYAASGSGVWQTRDFNVKDGESIHFHGPGRAAGVPIVAGLALRAELLAGRVPHRVAMATWYNAYRQFVFPAAWTDGFRDEGLPEGAAMQLDPALDLRAYELSPAATALAQAMQSYGMVNVDNARGNVVYTQGLYGGRGAESWDGVLGSDELKRIPLEKYRVLKLGLITHMGDNRSPGQR